MPRLEFGERRRAADRRVEGVDVPVVHRDHRDDLLRQHVERVAGIAAGFDLRLAHRARHRRAGNQIAAILRHDDAAAGGPDRVSGAADPLQPARHRRRRLDLDDQIDCAHVDAELERRGRHQPADLAGLQPILDLDALRPRQRAVMRPDEHLAGQLVECRGQPFRDAAAVDEDQRGPMRTHQLQQPRMNRRPDRAARPRGRRGPARNVFRLPHLRHVLDRHLDAQIEPLLLRGVDDGDGAVVDGGAVGRGELVVDGFVGRGDRLGRPRLLRRPAPWRSGARLPRVGGDGDRAGEKSRDLGERTLRRGQADALHGGRVLPPEGGSHGRGGSHGIASASAGSPRRGVASAFRRKIPAFG